MSHLTERILFWDAAQVRLITSAGFISAKVEKVDAANDLALLKAEGQFAALPVAASRGVKLGGPAATVGFPNIGLQGFAPKLAKGEIASLSGAADDARYFQISVPVQPGNSGGALVDERGNVVGVVAAKLNTFAALVTSGALPENVNYAIKSSYRLGFLESVPDVAAKLKEPETKERKFEDMGQSRRTSCRFGFGLLIFNHEKGTKGIGGVVFRFRLSCSSCVSWLNSIRPAEQAPVLVFIGTLALTPALSPEERENYRQSLCDRCVPSWLTLLVQAALLVLVY